MTAPSINAIVSVCAAVFDVTEMDIRSRRKNQQCVRPRHAVAHLARKLTGLSYPEIGHAFGSHHSTIIAGCRMAAIYLDRDPEFANRIARCEELLPDKLGEDIDPVTILNALREAERASRRAANLIQRKIGSAVRANGGTQ